MWKVESSIIIQRSLGFTKTSLLSRCLLCSQWVLILPVLSLYLILTVALPTDAALIRCPQNGVFHFLWDWLVLLRVKLKHWSLCHLFLFLFLLYNVLTTSSVHFSLQTDTTCWDQKLWKVSSTCTDSPKTPSTETGDGTCCRVSISTQRYRQLNMDQITSFHY